MADPDQEPGLPHRPLLAPPQPPTPTPHTALTGLEASAFLEGLLVSHLGLNLLTPVLVPVPGDMRSE